MACQIRCRDCGDERTTLYRNTRYCMSCRLLRDLTWLDVSEQRPCRANSCNAAFLPVSRKDLYCGECAGGMVGTHGRCSFCKTDPAPLHRGMAVCASCVRDAGERPRIMAGLRKGQAKRKKQHAVELAAARAEDARIAALPPLSL